MIRLSLAQINTTVGDLPGNLEKVLDYARRAREEGSDLVLFPELCLTGYPPEDLLLQPRFTADNAASIQKTAKNLPRGIAAVVGFAEGSPGRLYNAAALLLDGRVRAVYRKQRLPNYGVFDEQRYFLAGRKPVLFSLRGAWVGVTICEDIWIPRGPALQAAKAGARLILNLSASPYHAGKGSERLKMLKDRVKETRAAFAYCNAVGGQDELVFDGGGLVLDGGNRLLARAPQFEEALLTLDLEPPPARKTPRGTTGLSLPSAAPLSPQPPSRLDSLVTEPLPEMEEIYTALVTGTRDYLRKNGFRKAVIGLSGGIDSSLVACVAADALGKGNVTGVTLPSKFNSLETRSDAQRLAENLGIEFRSVPIQGIVDECLKALKPLFGDRPPDLAEENLQARVRGLLLMALSNKFGWMVLTTGNKSETSVGYCTLYGDTAGGFAVIKDIPKTLVYRLCRWRNEKAGRELIPQDVFDRPPTAELKPNQTDQDTLPPYDLLDRIIALYVERDESLSEITKRGVPLETAARTLRLIDASEYKRRQAPPGVKITPRAFGRDRRMPLTNRYRQGGPRP